MPFGTQREESWRAEGVGTKWQGVLGVDIKTTLDGWVGGSVAGLVKICKSYRYKLIGQIKWQLFIYIYFFF